MTRDSKQADEKEKMLLAHKLMSPNKKFKNEMSSSNLSRLIDNTGAKTNKGERISKGGSMNPIHRNH